MADGITLTRILFSSENLKVLGNMQSADRFALQGNDVVDVVQNPRRQRHFPSLTINGLDGVPIGPGWHPFGGVIPHPDLCPF